MKCAIARPFRSCWLRRRTRRPGSGTKARKGTDAGLIRIEEKTIFVDEPYSLNVFSLFGRSNRFSKSRFRGVPSIDQIRPEYCRNAARAEYIFDQCDRCGEK